MAASPACNSIFASWGSCSPAASPFMLYALMQEALVPVVNKLITSSNKLPVSCSPARHI